MLETVLFYLISAGVLAFAIGVVTCRSAIYSVLCLVASMGLMAGLFILLKAFLVATILVLVYAGAILVLFIFVVMLIDFKSVSLDWQVGKFSVQPFFAVLAGFLFFIQSMQVIRFVELPETKNIQGTAENIGNILFHKYVLPFELTSFLLLAAVVSVVVLAKKEVKS